MDGPLHPALELTEAEAAHRFWSKVNEGERCWLWHKPSKSRLGPRFQYKGNDVKIARMAFYFSQGHWPYGGAIRTCGNGLCCRPRHLVDLPQKDVPGFLVDHGRHKHGTRPRLSICKRGHSMEGENLGISSRQRFCRTCFNMNRRKQYQLAKEAKANGIQTHVTMQGLSVSLRRQAVSYAGAGS